MSLRARVRVVRVQRVVRVRDLDLDFSGDATPDEVSSKALLTLQK